VNEPIYEFVKGQGWVVNPPTIVTMRCKARVKIEIRDPEPGERCIWDWAPGHSVDWWIGWCTNNTLNACIQFERWGIALDESSRKRQWMVVTPV
jgi:hypothetical protein